MNLRDKITEMVVKSLKLEEFNDFSGTKKFIGGGVYYNQEINITPAIDLDFASMGGFQKVKKYFFESKENWREGRISFERMISIMEKIIEQSDSFENTFKLLEVFTSGFRGWLVARLCIEKCIILANKREELERIRADLWIHPEIYKITLPGKEILIAGSFYFPWRLKLLQRIGTLIEVSSSLDAQMAKKYDELEKKTELKVV